MVMTSCRPRWERGLFESRCFLASTLALEDEEIQNMNNPYTVPLLGEVKNKVSIERYETELYRYVGFGGK
jgi:hypothetical protein